MNVTQYKQFYDQVGAINGWNFSHVKVTSEGVDWDFYTEVTKLCKRSDLLLDIGTGGGEALLSIADYAHLLIGMDYSTSMFEAANNNLTRANIHNVRFVHMEADNLTFPYGFFNIVSSRHSCFYAQEIDKVLTPDGVFLTQQVSEDDKLNIKEAFGRGLAYRTKKGSLQAQYIYELNEAGFHHIQAYEYNATEYYQTAEDLLFLLKHTPIIPEFGQHEHDFQILEQFIADHQTDKGIRTNSERFMIIARK